MIVLAMLALLVGALIVTRGGAALPGFSPLPGGAAPPGVAPLPPWVYEPAPVPWEATTTMLPGGHHEFDEVIRGALRSQGIPHQDVDRYAVFMKALIAQESAWNPQARGDFDPAKCPQRYRQVAGTEGYCSLGLGQIHRYWNPDLASGYDLLDPTRNVAAVAVKLSRLRLRLGDDLDRIAAGYNGGASAGAAYPAVSTQVQTYVARLRASYQVLAAQLPLA